MNDRETPGLSIDCRGVVELVTEYLEGGLPPDLTSEVEAHLALCEGCQVYLEQMRRTIDELGRVPVETLPPDAQAELLAAFRTFRAGDAAPADTPVPPATHPVGTSAPKNGHGTPDARRRGPMRHIPDKRQDIGPPSGIVPLLLAVLAVLVVAAVVIGIAAS